MMPGRPRRLAFAAFLLGACWMAPAPVAAGSNPCKGAASTHRLERGETLYRVARNYGVPLDDLLETNGITDPRHVASGRTLTIPCGPGSRVEAPPLPDSGARLPLDDPDFVEVSGDEPPDEALNEIAAESRLLGSSPCGTGGAPELLWPVPASVSSPFGPRRRRQHAGVDLRAPIGAPVHSAACGIVAAVRHRSRGYGTVVTVDHGDGVITLYAHLKEADVSEGQQVAAGEILGLVGRTGNATGPHLHFEVRREGKPQNPADWLPPASIAATAATR